MSVEQIAVAWGVSCFGLNTMGLKERAARLLEEAIEVAQVAGLSVDDISGLTFRCYRKKPGEIMQELGGIAVTAGMLFASQGTSYSEMFVEGMCDAVRRTPEIIRKHKEKDVTFD